MLRFCHFLLILLTSSFFAEASPTCILILKTNASYFNENIAVEARYHGLNRIALDKTEVFTVIKNGQSLGKIISGKGWGEEVKPVCFIGWSKDGKKIDQFMPTIGQGDWETVGCHKVDSMGLISKKNDDNAKLAVVYTIEAADHYGNDYYVVGFSKGSDIYYDSGTTDKFQNSHLKTIQELRKVYQK